MTKRTYGQGFLNLLPVLLFAVLAATVLSVLLSGVQLYSNMTREQQQGYLDRTVQQYVCTKVRQAQSPSAVSVEDFGGACALVIRQELEGEHFIERIYCYDGFLRELFTFSDSEMLPEDGEQLLELSAFSAALENDLLTLSFCDADGNSQTIYLDLSEEAYHET